MLEEKTYIAIDLGASNGRAMLGRFNGTTLVLEEVHRFPNGPVEEEDGLHWDAEGLFNEIKIGIGKAVAVAGDSVSSVGVDSWGVDYGLLGVDGKLIENPFNYRDSRTDGVPEEAFKRVSRDTIFEKTGIQFMQINTLYQLMSDVLAENGKLERADCLLMMADLFNYMLTGKKRNERTLASTSQCFNPKTGTWAVDITDKLGIPSKIFPDIVEAGSILGKLLPEIAVETGAENLSVIAVASHDTASAVVATPAEGEDFAYLSSGTWALLGTELSEPIISTDCLRSNFTNESGAFGTIRLLRNATGLWVLQECRRVWNEAGANLSFDKIDSLIDAAEPFVALIDPDAADFQSPGDMPARIREYCRRTGQNVPDDKGVIARIALESLALKCRFALEQVEELAGIDAGTLHVVGGGTKNKLLNQFVSNAIGRRVVAGPTEATALGNVIVQMVALGDLQSVEEGRALIRRSFDMETYEPVGGDAWDAACERLKKIIE